MLGHLSVVKILLSSFFYSHHDFAILRIILFTFFIIKYKIHIFSFLCVIELSTVFIFLSAYIISHCNFSLLNESSALLHVYSQNIHANDYGFMLYYCIYNSCNCCHYQHRHCCYSVSE
jgi:hypothetical protein